MSRAADLQLLHFDIGDEPAPVAVKEHFRIIALQVHPDVGGDQETFDAVRGAYKRLLMESEQSFSRCPDCAGTGHVDLRTGFYCVKQSCARCCGTGKR
jgi:DnaJ-class molecular chaperone